MASGRGRKKRTGGSASTGANGNEYFEELTRLLTVTRCIPTLQLFDAVWQVEFKKLVRAGQGDIAKYLMDTYFVKVTVSNLSKQMRLKTPAWGASAVLFAGFWVGVLGTHPGTGSGTQTIESFHAHWQRSLEGQLRPSPVRLFEVMEAMYRGDWSSR